MSDDKVQSPEIVAAWLTKHQIVYRYGEFYQFDGRYYESLTREILRNRLSRFIVTEFGWSAATARMVSECVDMLRDMTVITGECQPFYMADPDDVASVLCVQNGILNLEPMYAGEGPQLLPHSPDLFATSVGDYSHDPMARCEKFDQFVRWFSSGDEGVERLLLQFMAYCLLRRLDLQKFLLLVGMGSNGKSVFLSVLRRLVGAENCSALSFERIGGRFDLSSLADKAVNVAADANEISKVAEGALKMLVDRSPQVWERKYQNSFTAVCHARFIFAANVSPRWRDRTDGLWRRMIIVPCLAKAEGDGVIRNLEDTFDYSGILNRVLEAGKALIDQGDFVIPQVVSDAVAAERMEANPTKQFLTEHVTTMPSAFTATDTLYRSYATWCDNGGYMPLARNNFGKELRMHFATALAAGQIKPGKSTGRDRQNGYHGLKYYPNGVATEAAMSAEIDAMILAAMEEVPHDAA